MLRQKENARAEKGAQEGSGRMNSYSSQKGGQGKPD